MFAKESNQSTSQANFAPVQTVQTNAEDGTWMSLKEAENATGLCQKTISRHIEKGLIESRKLGKLRNSPVQVLITDKLKAAKGTVSADFVEIFDSQETEAEVPSGAEDASESFQPDKEASSTDSAHQNWGGAEARGDVQMIAKAIALGMTEAFSKEIAEKQSVIVSMNNELVEKDRQLRLLPDIQRQLEEREKQSHLVTSAMEKQIEALKEEVERLREAGEIAKQSAQAKKNWWQSIFASGSSDVAKDMQSSR